MLPILRASLLGSVLVGLFVLVAGSHLPAVKRAHIARLDAPARGPLIDEADHPEWKQFLVLAALQRAHELERLRDLPDTPVRTEQPRQPAAARVVTLPASPSDGEPDEATGAVDQTIGTIPVDIGAASSAELPIQPKDAEPPPALKPPETKKPDTPVADSPRKPPRRARSAKSKPDEQPTGLAVFNPFRVLFGAITNNGNSGN